MLLNFLKRNITYIRLKQQTLIFLCEIIFNQQEEIFDYMYTAFKMEPAIATSDLKLPQYKKVSLLTPINKASDQLLF
jgi:hypothetical protein